MRPLRFMRELPKNVWPLLAVVLVVIGGVPTMAAGAAGGVLGLPERVAILEGNIATIQQQIANQGQRITSLENASLPLSLIVQCGTGETVADALSRAAGRLTITLVGVCQESVTIFRNSVVLQGALPGDGLAAPSSGSTLLTLDGVHRITLNQLTLAGGATGLVAKNGASFFASSLHVTGATNSGIEVTTNASGTLTNSTVEGNRTGLAARLGGALAVSGGQTANNSTGVVADQGGQVSLFNGVSVSSNETGVQAQSGASVHLFDTTLEGSTYAGGRVGPGGSIFLNGSNAVIKTTSNGPALVMEGGAAFLNGGQITNNAQRGIHADNGSTVSLNNGASVDSNGEDGLQLIAGSSALVVNSKIQGNTGNGVFISDASAVSFGPQAIGGQVKNNTGWGIFCQAYPRVPQAIGEPLVSGNTGGNSNCPGLVIP